MYYQITEHLRHIDAVPSEDSGFMTAVTLTSREWKDKKDSLGFPDCAGSGIIRSAAAGRKPTQNTCPEASAYRTGTSFFIRL